MMHDAREDACPRRFSRGFPRVWPAAGLDHAKDRLLFRCFRVKCKEKNLRSPVYEVTGFQVADEGLLYGTL